MSPTPEYTGERPSRLRERILGQHRNSFDDRSAAGWPAADTGHAPTHTTPARSRGRSARRSFERSPDWPRVGLFSAGLALGAVLGAGSALLFTPRTGEETRELLGKQARRVGHRVSDGWDDLRTELRRAGRRGRRKVRRGVTRGRWAVEDVRDRY